MMCNISSNCLASFARGGRYACVFHINKAWISASIPKDNSGFSLEPWHFEFLALGVQPALETVTACSAVWEESNSNLRRTPNSLVCYKGKRAPKARKETCVMDPTENCFLWRCVYCVHAQNDSVTFLKNKEIEMMRFGSAYMGDQRISVSQTRGIRKVHLTVLFSPNILLNL